MFELTLDLYNSVISSINRYGIINETELDIERYTTSSKYNMWHSHFQLIEDELDRSIRFGGMKYICDSKDVCDYIECGDYNYYTSFLSHNIPMLYIQASHVWHSPSYIKIYGNNITIEICTAKKSIDIYNTNNSVRNIYLYMDTSYMIELLKNTDMRSLYDI